jgi:hypothetical protein
MSIIQNFTGRYCRRRFAILFFTLLITIVAAPVFGTMGLSTRFMEIFVALNILAAVLVTLFSLSAYLGLGLLTLVIAARGGYALLGLDPLLVTSRGIGAVICLISVCIMLGVVLSKGSVTSERVFAALDVYLLGGILCGLLFCVMEEEWPGSFSFQESHHPGEEQNPLAHTIYFSFVTLGTLGYGDIIPLGGPARALAVVEAISGQMYLVVVVARLVSLYHGESNRSAE